MNDPQDMETLAALEHEQWSGWMTWMLAEVRREIGDRPTRAEIEELPCVQRWRRQMETSYADLTEHEKESDRKEVRKRLPSYRPTLTQLLTVDEVAEHLTVHPATVRRLVNDGELNGMRIGHRMVIHPDDLRAYVGSHRTAGGKVEEVPE